MTAGGHGGNYYIYNNTLYNNFEAEIDIDSGVGTNGLMAPTSVTIKNNIVYNPTKYITTRVATAPTTTASNNLYYGNALPIPTWDSTSAIGNPLFFKTAPATLLDFQLQGTSPAIDSGVNLSSVFTKDFLGYIRPQGSTFDIGAYEYVSSVLDTTPPSAPTGLTVV